MCVHLDLRQCLIYDSCKPDARLIGVEFMIPKERYEQLDLEEQKYCKFAVKLPIMSFQVS